MKTALFIVFIGSIVNALSPYVYPQYGGTCQTVKSCVRDDLDRLLSQFVSPQPGYEQFPKMDPWGRWNTTGSNSSLEERVRILESYHKDHYPCNQRGEFKVKGNCFHVSSYPMILSAAHDYCKVVFNGNDSFGRHEPIISGRLFEPHDPSTAKNIYEEAFKRLRRAKHHPNHRESYWIGIDDMDHEGVFIYDSNHEIVPPAFQKWGADEPNDWNNGEDCVEVKKYNDEYNWNDINCYDKVRALCERVKEDSSFHEVEELNGRLDVLEKKSYMYYQPGHVQLSKDNLVWINQLWGKEFRVEFEIRTKSKNDFANFPSNGYNSVFSIYADKGGDRGFEKDLPSVYLIKVYNSATGLYDPTIEIKYLNKKRHYAIAFETRQHFELSVEKEADGKFYWKIHIDTKNAYDYRTLDDYKEEITPKRYYSAHLYLSSYEHNVFEEKYGMLENLKIINIEQEKEFKKGQNHTQGHNHTNWQFPEYPQYPPFIIGKK